MDIWTKDIKRETIIHENIFMKALETKQFIKHVVTIQNKAIKLFMATTFKPSKEITSGNWYSDEKPDTEFIVKLKQVCLGSLSTKKGCKLATIDMVLDFIEKKSVFNVEVPIQSLGEFFNKLVMNDKVYEVKSIGFDNVSGAPAGRLCYRIKSKVGCVKEEKASTMASTHCGVYLRITFCTHGVVSPTNCVIMING